MILKDSQLREIEYQDVGFDFALRILTTRCWKQQLNGEGSKADQLRLEEKLMGSVVPHKFSKYFDNINDGRKPPLKDEMSNDCPTVDGDDVLKKQDEPSTSTEIGSDIRHHLLLSPPTPGQENTTRTGFLGPPPPVTSGQGCPPLQVWPPAELVSSTSGVRSSDSVGTEV